MNAKNPKFAIAPKGTYNSITGGKKYPVTDFDGDSFSTISDIGGNIFTLTERSAHLNGKNWILRNK